ncbi:MAG: hypothetical protein ACE149_00345 [Armatimonadota bacterium]
MTRLGWMAGAVVLVAIVAGTVLYGQGDRGERQGGPPPGPGAFDRERMTMTLELLGLSKAETAAALKAGEAKWKARQALEEERSKLRALADDLQAKDQQLRDGIAAYTREMGRYRSTVQSEDTALVKQLSLRSRAHCLAAGVLDNGLGMGGRQRGGGGRRGGEAGGFGGRQ